MFCFEDTSVRNLVHSEIGHLLYVIHKIKEHRWLARNKLLVTDLLVRLYSFERSRTRFCENYLQTGFSRIAKETE